MGGGWRRVGVWGAGDGCGPGSGKVRAQTRGGPHLAVVVVASVAPPARAVRFAVCSTAVATEPALVRTREAVREDHPVPLIARHALRCTTECTHAWDGVTARAVPCCAPPLHTTTTGTILVTGQWSSCRGWAAAAAAVGKVQARLPFPRGTAGCVSYGIWRWASGARTCFHGPRIIIARAGGRGDIRICLRPVLCRVASSPCRIARRPPVRGGPAPAARRGVAWRFKTRGGVYPPVSGDKLPGEATAVEAARRKPNPRGARRSRGARARPYPRALRRPRIYPTQLQVNPLGPS